MADDAKQTKLHNSWTLWYDNPRLAPEGTSWHDQLNNLGTFNSAEEFWSIFNNIQPSSALALNSNYHLFREGTGKSSKIDLRQSQMQCKLNWLLILMAQQHLNNDLKRVNERTDLGGRSK